MNKNSILKGLGNYLLAGALSLASYSYSAQPTNSSVNSLESKISGNKYFIAVNADNSKVHMNNLVNSCNSLLAQSFPKTNLYVFCPTTVPPTKNNFLDFMNIFSDSVNDKDTVVIYTTGHADSNTNSRGYLALTESDKGRSISPNEFISSIKNLHNAKIVYVGDQCYSGTFLNEIKSSGLNAVAVVNSDESHDSNCSYFSDNFWKAMSGEIVTQTMDRNFNFVNTTNKINTVKEAFDYAVNKNRTEGRNDNQRWQFYASPGMENFSIGSNK